MPGVLSFVVFPTACLAFYLVKQESLLSQVNHPNREGHELAAKVIAKLFGVE